MNYSNRFLGTSIGFFIGLMVVTIWSETEWLGFWGNIVGGAIGGVVAFSVAKYTFDQQNRQLEEDRFKDQLPVLVQIRTELLKMHRGYRAIVKVNEAKKARHDDEVGEPALTVFPMQPIDEQMWVGIEKITDNILQSQLLEAKSVYTEIQKLLYVDVGSMHVKSLLLNKKLEVLKSVQDPSDEVRVATIDAEVAATLALNDFHTQYLQRKMIWTMATETDHLEIVRIILDSVDDMINEIKQT